MKQSEWKIDPGQHNFYVPIMFNFLNTKLIKTDSNRPLQNMLSGKGGTTLNLGKLELTSYDVKNAINLCNTDLYLFITLTENDIQGLLRVCDSKFKHVFEKTLINMMKTVLNDVLEKGGC